MFLDVGFIELDLLKNNQKLWFAGGSFSLVCLINYFQKLKKRKKYCHLPKKKTEIVAILAVLAAHVHFP